MFVRRAEGQSANNLWPDLSDAALAADADWLMPALADKTALAQLSADEFAAALKSLLPYPLQRRLEAEAPTHFDAPSGSRVPIDYEAEGGPKLAIRVQELFGLDRHPAIAGGKIPLLVELLSPAHRPVQLTRDLPGFWRGSYAAVRTEMRGRYPRHPWPDDPHGGDRDPARQAAQTGRVKHQIVAGRNLARRLARRRQRGRDAGWRRARRARRRHRDDDRNRSQHRRILRAVAQRVVAGVAGIGTIDQLNAADQMPDALRLGADIHRMNFDVLDARAEAAVARRLVEIKRGMRYRGAIHVPSGMFANDDGMIGRSGAGYLFFQRSRLARGAQQATRERTGNGRAYRRTAARANRFQMPSIKKTLHRCLPYCWQS